MNMVRLGLVRHVGRSAGVAQTRCGSTRAAKKYDSKYNEWAQMQDVKIQVRRTLGALPLATSQEGMRKLVRSGPYGSESDKFEEKVIHSKPLVVKHLWARARTIHKKPVQHEIMPLIGRIIAENAAFTGVHPGEDGRPLPLFYKPTMLGLLCQVFKPNDAKLKQIPEIYSLLEAGVNIQKVMTENPAKFTGKLHLQLNQLSLLGSDYLMAFANDLTAQLNDPIAQEKISKALSRVTQLAMIADPEVMKNYANDLWRECAEAIVVSANGTTEELELVRNFIESICRALHAKWAEDNSSAFHYKMQAIQHMQQLAQLRNVTPEIYNAIEQMVLAAVPVKQPLYH